MSRAVIHAGDCLAALCRLPDGVARCCVTSPPYFGLRDYGMEGQLGLEDSPAAYVARLVEVFREVRRVLAEDGTLWLNLGDSYVSAPQGPDLSSVGLEGSRHNQRESRRVAGSFRRDRAEVGMVKHRRDVGGLKPKNLLGIPWRVAFALQEDGWFLRSDIIWHKPNPMPESVTDRPTKAHEYVFLLSKRERYYYDAGAIAEEATGRNPGNVTPNKHAGEAFSETKANLSLVGARDTRNARTVWSIATQPYPEAHFATFPEELPSRCIRAGSAPGDTVLDPFGGSGTTGAIAVGLGRSAILCELNPAYIELARQRIGPMLCEEERPRSRGS